MEIQQKQKIEDQVQQEEEKEGNKIRNTKHQQVNQEDMQSTKQQAAMASPPSPSSSPTHEFSFAISLNSSSTPNFDETKPEQAPSAIDLTPADDIFFHGHLLPLHLLTNLPVSPRFSTNSLDSFTLPVKELINPEGKHNNIDSCICSNCDRTRGHSFNSYEYSTRRNRDLMSYNDELPSKRRTKSKSFSLFGLARRQKEDDGKGEGEDQGEKHKKKLRFDLGHFLKRYIRMFSKGRREDIQFMKQPYSFSGKHSPREGRRDLRGRRGEFSAPASMRTSPTNSGILSATSRANPAPSNDSTMEELQAAIQAAIAHCKNSIAAAEKLKS